MKRLLLFLLLLSLQANACDFACFSFSPTKMITSELKRYFYQNTQHLHVASSPTKNDRKAAKKTEIKKTAPKGTKKSVEKKEASKKETKQSTKKDHKKPAVKKESTTKDNKKPVKKETAKKDDKKAGKKADAKDTKKSPPKKSAVKKETDKKSNKKTESKDAKKSSKTNNKKTGKKADSKEEKKPKKNTSNTPKQKRSPPKDIWEDYSVLSAGERILREQRRLQEQDDARSLPQATGKKSGKFTKISGRLTTANGCSVGGQPIAKKWCAVNASSAGKICSAVIGVKGEVFSMTCNKKR